MQRWMSISRDKEKCQNFFLKDLGQIERAAGIAMGLDRLFMFFLGKDHLEDVVTFSADDLDS